MFLSIRKSINEVLHELKQLRKGIGDAEGWAGSFRNQLARALGREVKLQLAQRGKSVRGEGCQTTLQIVLSSTQDLWKRPRELTVSLQGTPAKNPEMNRHKASPRVEDPARKNLWTKKPKPEAKKPNWPRCARPDAVLIEPAEGVIYAAILKDLKEHVKPGELSVTVHGIRETCS